MIQQDGKFVTVATKVSQETADILNKIAQAKGVKIYELMQLVVQFLVRSTKCEHNLSDEMRKLLVMWHNEHMWRGSYNMCANAATEIDQEVLIMRQKGRKGFGATMVNKPFMGDCTQTECVDDIVERVVEVCMPGVYRRLRRLAVDMDCDSLTDLLILLTDSAAVQALEDSDRKEMEASADYVETGRSRPRQPWQSPSVRHHRRDPDSLDNDRRIRQTTIRFDEDDVPDLPELDGSQPADDWLKEHTDFRPHGEDW